MINSIKNSVYNIIINKDYYKTITFSKQISSYWRKYCALQNVERTNEGFQLRGIGFGDFQEKNILNSIKSIPSRIYNSKLLKGCDKNIIDSIRFVANQSSRIFSYDLTRQALTVNKLCQILSGLETKTFCIIGDGVVAEEERSKSCLQHLWLLFFLGNTEAPVAFTTLPITAFFVRPARNISPLRGAALYNMMSTLQF